MLRLNQGSEILMNRRITVSDWFAECICKTMTHHDGESLDLVFIRAIYLRKDRNTIENISWEYL